MEKQHTAVFWVKWARKSAQGYIHGVELTPYATDVEILEVLTLKKRLAELHNRALARQKSGAEPHE